MFNLFRRPPLDNSNSESPEEHTSFNLDFTAKGRASINIKGEVLMKVLLLLLGGSVFGGGLFYSISNNLLPSNTEAGNNPSHTELVDQSSK